MASKKDYEAIAGIVKEHTFSTIRYRATIHPQDSSDIILKDDLVKHLSDYFEKDNPNFNRDLFFKACYGKVSNKD